MNKESHRGEVRLSDADRCRLESLIRKRSLAQGIAGRIRIVLLCNRNMSDLRIAERLGVSPITVGKWRKRFLSQGLEGLFDAPRSGAPRSISEEAIESVLRLTRDLPEGAPRWSTRALAKQCGVSQSSVTRIRRLHEGNRSVTSIDPHRDQS